MPTIVGIDLGTTNTCIAHVSNKIPRVVPIEGGFNTMPSVVTLHQSGDIWVGQRAKEQMVTNPTRTVHGIKRLLGRRYDSPVVRQVSHRYSYEVSSDPEGWAAVTIDDSSHSPTDIQTHILRQVKRYTEIHLGEEVPQVVIAVPAYFSDQQRVLVKDAARNAGWEVGRIVNEPTAAALAYGFNRGFDQKILVYDLGGGTFDVSVLEITGNVFQVIATGGDTFLGGADFDDRIINWALETFHKQTKIDISENPKVLQRLRATAEQAKVELSVLANTTIRVQAVAEKKGKPLDLELVLDRNTLNDLTRDLVDRTMDVCERILEERNLRKTDVTEIIAVGGQTRMPLVVESIEKRLLKTPRKGIHPDECVAIGAALLADSLTEIDAVTLLDAVSVPIGLSTTDGQMRIVVGKHTQLPHQGAVELPTEQDQQTEMRIDVFQGDEGTVANAEYLGSVIYQGIPPLPAGAVKVRLEFSLDEEGLLDLRASDDQSGREEHLTLITLDRPHAPTPEDTTDAESLQEPDTEEPKGLKGLVQGLWGKK